MVVQPTGMRIRSHRIPTPPPHLFLSPTLPPGPFNTLTEVGDVCGASRVWAGVHFWDAILAPGPTCMQAATLVDAKVRALVQGSQEANA